MKLAMHRNHRNSKYLKWLRTQNCVVSGEKAQCAHHIRLETNGGSGLKPSDYFCIPLKNEYHTTGAHALHIIGEDTFFKQFKLNRDELFLKFLKGFLKEEHNIVVEFNDSSDEDVITFIITLLEENSSQPEKKAKKAASKTKPSKPKVSITENEFYQKAKEAKRVQDKILRDQLKSEKPKVSSPTFKGNEFYEKAKEAKRAQDKLLREKLKSNQVKQKVSVTESEFYQKAKEQQKAYRKEQYRKSKELR